MTFFFIIISALRYREFQKKKKKIKLYIMLSDIILEKERRKDYYT